MKGIATMLCLMRPANSISEKAIYKDGRDFERRNTANPVAMTAKASKLGSFMPAYSEKKRVIVAMNQTAPRLAANLPTANCRAQI